LVLVTDSVAFELRKAAAEDEAFLEKLYAECHLQEFAPLGLNEVQLAGLLRMQARGQREGYARDFPGAVDQIVVDVSNGERVGRFLVDAEENQFYLIDIALVHVARNRGIGTALLQGLMRQADAAERPIRLHVRPDNPAGELYRRLGFREVSRGLQVEMQYRPDAPEPPAARKAQLKELHPMAEEWKARVGRNFIVGNVRWEQGPLILRLASVDAARGFGTGCFALVFHGPLSAVLPQSTYLLVPEPLSPNRETSSGHGGPSTAEEESVFLVPIGPEGDVMRYEAVFNL
jgi:ribosomal protein S18 acetylase RimI-like enzyme